MVTPGKGKHCTGDNIDGKVLDDTNNFQPIGSNIIKRLQHNYVVQETFSHCDIINDKPCQYCSPLYFYLFMLSFKNKINLYINYYA